VGWGDVYEWDGMGGLYEWERIEKRGANSIRLARSYQRAKYRCPVPMLYHFL
jgi:hypothetical protein